MNGEDFNFDGPFPSIKMRYGIFSTYLIEKVTQLIINNLLSRMLPLHVSNYNVIITEVC